jgi:hypothetical protein
LERAKKLILQKARALKARGHEIVVGGEMKR